MLRRQPICALLRPARDWEVGEGRGGTKEGDLEGVRGIVRMLDEEPYEPFDEGEWEAELVS